MTLEDDLAPVVAALRRVVPLVAGVAWAVRKLALAAFGAAAVILAAVLWYRSRSSPRSFPHSPRE